MSRFPSDPYSKVGEAKNTATTPGTSVPVSPPMVTTNHTSTITLLTANWMKEAVAYKLHGVLEMNTYSTAPLEMSAYTARLTTASTPSTPSRWDTTHDPPDALAEMPPPLKGVPASSGARATAPSAIGPALGRPPVCTLAVVVPCNPCESCCARKSRSSPS